MAKRKQKSMSFTFMEVTPAQAKKWLEEANVGNRNVSNVQVHLIARDIKRGNFQVTHEAIAFDVNGRLIDGQHRLHAIVTANEPVSLWVATNCPSEAQKYLDAGRKRSMADAYVFYYGEQLNKRVEAITSAMIDPGMQCRFTRAEMAAFYQQHMDAIHFAVDAFKGVRRSIGPARIIAIIGRAYYTQDRERLRQFATILKTGMILGPGDKAAIELRDFLMTEEITGNTIRRWLYRRAEYLLAQFLAGKSRFRKSEIADKELFPIPGERGYEENRAA